MSFFDQSKVDRKALEHQQAATEAEAEANRKKKRTQLKEKREREEFNLLVEFVNDALDEFPDMALRSGIKCKSIPLGSNLLPVALWPKIQVWNIHPHRYIGKNGTTYIGRGHSSENAPDSFVDRCSRKVTVESIAREIGQFDLDGHKRLFYEEIERYITEPPIEREQAKELVERWFMAFL